MFSYISAEQRVPRDHPLRPIRVMTDAALRELGPKFDAMYACDGRPSIAPEKLLRALLLQVLYTLRSERLLMEQLDYNLLFRWFVGLSIDDPVWDATSFSKNRERLLKGEVAEGFFAAVVEQARAQGLLSDEHFTVDGTLIEAWAGHKSFKPKDDGDAKAGRDDDPSNPSVDFERQTGPLTTAMYAINRTAHSKTSVGSPYSCLTLTCVRVPSKLVPRNLARYGRSAYSLGILSAGTGIFQGRGLVLST
jgi:transposase